MPIKYTVYIEIFHSQIVYRLTAENLLVVKRERVVLGILFSSSLHSSLWQNLFKIQIL